MQKIFTATVGRSGSHNLAVLFNRFGTHCIAEHEPPDLLLRQLGQQAFFRRRGWLGAGSKIAHFGRNSQRKFLVTDEMLGRGSALEWYDQGKTDKLAKLAARKLRRIQRFERRGYQHYVESGQFFLRTHCRALARLIPDLAVIKLTRDPLQAARSLANRNKKPFANSNPPDRPSNLFRLDDWRHLSPFQLYLHLWIETELRYYDFVERHDIERRFEIETPDLLDRDRLTAMFNYFGIAHDEIEPVPPTNANATPTLNTESDIADFHRMLEMVPPALLDRIRYLKDFEPQMSADQG